MIASAIESAANPELIEFVIYCDADDSSMNSFHHPKVTKILGPRKSVSNMTNECFRISKGSIIMYAADDVIFRSRNWDEVVRKFAEKNDFFLVYGNDLGQQNLKIPTHGFISRNLVERLGYLLNENFNADFCDTWLGSVTKIAGCLFYDETLLIEHMHPSWKKAEPDQTYLDRQSKKKFLRNYLKYQLLTPLRILDGFKILISIHSRKN
jgi:hypothetical protein